MRKESRKQLQTLAEAFNRLPKNKREYLIGYAEGVIAAHEDGGAARDGEVEAVEKDSA